MNENKTPQLPAISRFVHLSFGVTMQHCNMHLLNMSLLINCSYSIKTYYFLKSQKKCCKAHAVSSLKLFRHSIKNYYLGDTLGFLEHSKKADTDSIHANK